MPAHLRVIAVAVMLIALCLPVLAIGQEDGGGAGDTFNFVSPDTDSWLERISGVDSDNLFTDYLEALLGDDEERSLVAEAGGIANVVGLILAVVILVYVMIASVVKTASEGQVLGRNWSTIWLPVRVSLGIALLMPVNNGISPAQNIILGLADLGNRLATITWNGAVDRLGDGVQLVETPGYNNGISFMESQLSSLVCAEAVHQQEAGENGKPWGHVLVRGQGGSERELRTINEGLEAGGGNLNLPSLEGASEILFGAEGECGSMDLRSVGDTGGDPDYLQEALTAGDAVVREELVTQLQAIAPAALALISSSETSVGSSSGELPGLGGRDAYDALVEDNKATPEAAQRISQHLWSIYASTNERMVGGVYDAIRENSDFVDDFKERLKENGWVTAGAWFLELDRFQTLGSNVLSSAYSGMESGSDPASCEPSDVFNRNSGAHPMNGGGRPDPTPVCREIKGDISLAPIAINGAIDIGRDSGGLSQNLGASAEDLRFCEDSECSKSSAFDNLSRDVSKGLLQVFMSTGQYFNESETSSGQMVESVDIDRASYGMVNPFQMVSNLGHGIQAFNTAFTVANVVFAAGAYGSGESVLSLAGGGAAKGVYIALSPLIVSVITVGFGAGFVLAFVIPFMPAVLWTLMVIRYFINVLEGFFAAPLAVAQMVTPEGEGISGTRMERAWALMAAIIVRPPFMVLGLLAAMAVAWVGFSIMNSIFWQVISMNTTIGFWEILAILILYPSIAVMVIKRSVSVMQTAPDAILEWFSGGVGGGFGSESTREGLDTAGQHMQSASQAVHKGGLQAAERKEQEIQRRQEQDNRETRASAQQQDPDERGNR